MNLSTQDNARSLTVIGTGIKFKSHLTTEAQTYIKESDLVLYLVNEPAMREWITHNSRKSEALNRFYSANKRRHDSYKEMSDHVVGTLSQYQHVCFVLYGHPTIVSKPGIDAAAKAKSAGYQVNVLPAVSAEDCLFADLMINPASSGCQSYEATDFLIYRRKADSACHVILWQIGFIGALDYPRQFDNSAGINLLTETLLQTYHPDHTVILYEAAQYPHINPSIQTIGMKDLPSASCSAITTLYIPPAKKSVPDDSILKKLNIVR